MDIERAQGLLAAERREIEQALSHLAHEDDGEDAGWLSRERSCVQVPRDAQVRERGFPERRLTEPTACR